MIQSLWLLDKGVNGHFQTRSQLFFSQMAMLYTEKARATFNPNVITLAKSEVTAKTETALLKFSSLKHDISWRLKFISKKSRMLHCYSNMSPRKNGKFAGDVSSIIVSDGKQMAKFQSLL